MNFLQGILLPPFVTKRWRQKCPQGTFAGSGQRMSLSDHARSAPFAHDRSGRSILCPLYFRLRCNAEAWVRCAQRLLLPFRFSAGRRPARSHCEKSGESGGNSASARSDRAQTAQILRDRSASVGADTRCFSPCLSFWYFWVKPKVQKKRVGRIPKRLFELSARNSFTTFCHQKVEPKVSAGHLRRERTKDVTERSRKICAVCARSLRAFHPLSALFPSTVQCRGLGALRATIICDRIFCKPQVCTIALRKRRRAFTSIPAPAPSSSAVFVMPPADAPEQKSAWSRVPISGRCSGWTICL